MEKLSSRDQSPIVNFNRTPDENNQMRNATLAQIVRKIPVAAMSSTLKGFLVQIRRRCGFTHR